MTMLRVFLQSAVPVLILVPAIYALFAAETPSTIAVDAGKVDRRDALVSFRLPPEMKGKIYGLIDESGNTIPLQADSSGRAAFVLSQLKAGQTMRYTVRLRDAQTVSRIHAASDGRLLRITADDRPVLDYRLKAELP